MSGVSLRLTFLSVAVALALCHGSFAQSCGGELSLPPDSSLDIWSPGYPSPYDAGAQCLWKIQSPDGYKIVFNCGHFDIQMSTYCAKDSLSISPSGDIGMSDSSAYCGQSPSPDVVSTGRNLAIMFRSDFYYSASGFHCTASSVPETSLPPPAPKTRSSLTQSDSCECGVKGASAKIVGGTETGANEFPWQASIQSNNGEAFCGGTVIDKQWILTAAHCMEGVNPAELRVVLGAHDLTKQTSTSASFAVDNVISNEGYDSTTVANDIALIHLTQPIDSYSDAIRPVCLPWGSTDTYESKDSTVTGWGKTSNDGQASPTLQKVSIPINPNSECTSKLETAFNKDQNLCASQPGKDSCDGDSGGPLQLQNSTDGRTYQVGIVSWGVSCDDPTYPAVYTRVTNYLDWIKEKATGAEFCTPADPSSTTAPSTTAGTSASTSASDATTAASTTAGTSASTSASDATTAASTSASESTTAAVDSKSAATTVPADSTTAGTSASTSASDATTAASTTAGTSASTSASDSTTAAAATTAGSTTAASTTPSSSSLKDVCGQSNPSGVARIVGGSETAPHQYPWNILVLNKTAAGYESVCGGSLINEEWIMTAAKCVSGKATDGLQIDLGEHDVTKTSDGPRTQVVVDRVIVHEQFNSPSVMNNDIALLHLSKPTTFSDKIRPVCLPFSLASQTFVGNQGNIAGWGKTSTASETKSPVLNQIAMSVIDNDKCRTSGFGKYMTPNMICIKGTAGQGTCTGDGGAPFVFNNPGDNKFYQIGIESFGLKATCDSGGPFAYERVTSHLGWITEKTGISY